MVSFCVSRSSEHSPAQRPDLRLEFWYVALLRQNCKTLRFRGTGLKMKVPIIHGRHRPGIMVFISPMNLLQKVVLVQICLLARIRNFSFSQFKNMQRPYLPNQVRQKNCATHFKFDSLGKVSTVFKKSRSVIDDTMTIAAHIGDSYLSEKGA